MEQLITALSDVAAARAATSKPGNFHDNLLSYYHSLGQKLGYSAAVNSSLLRHGLVLGKLDCIWVKERPVVAVEVEFGGREEVLRSLWKMLELGPELAVLVMSSRSRAAFTIAELKTLFERSRLIKPLTQTFLLIDIESGRAEKVEHQQERYKPIYGTRVKAQD